MIRRAVPVALWLCLTVLCFGFRATSGVTTLSGIRYNSQDSSSRLTMQFSGEIRYSIRHEGSKLQLGFSTTLPDLSSGVSRFQFKDGFVRSVTTGRIGADSLSIVVVLREGTLYTLVRPAEGNALFVDVVPDPAYCPPVDTTPKVSKVVPKLQAPATSSLVDIPAIARTQVETPARKSEPDRPVSAVAETVAAGTPPTTGSGRTWSAALILGAGGLLALLTTSGILVLLRRRGRRTAEPTAKPRAAVAEEVAAAPEDIRAMLERASRRGAVAGQEPAPAFFEERTEMAKTFGRGTGEVQLALTLSRKGRPRANKERLEQVVLKRTSSAQRRTAARKLGVGVGEVELAHQLRQLQSKGKQKEGRE